MQMFLECLTHLSVLVAPSVRDGRWREQIGDAVGEALSAGTTVVTTSETGIAGWLAAHGHRVIPAESVRDDLAPAILSALSSPVPPADVVAPLPTVPVRLQVDRWLHGESLTA